jgi:iron complex outermembrane receptor protein
VQKNVDGELRLFGAGSQFVLDFGLEDQKLRLPGARTLAQLASDPRGTANPNDFANRDGTRFGLSGSSSHDMVDTSFDVNWRDSVRTSFQSGTYIDTHSRVLSFSPRVRIHHEKFGFPGTLILGLDLEDWDYQSLRANSLETLGAPTARILASQENRAFFVQNHSQVTPSTKLTLGFRQQQVEMAAVDRINAAAYAQGRKKSTPRSWEAGLAHDLDATSAIHGKWGQSFRVSTVDESYSQFGGPAGDAIVALLGPQISRDHELGYQYRSGATRARASAFLNELENEIHFYSPTFTNINLPPTRRKGIELDWSAPVSSGVSVFANIAAVDAKFRDGQLGGVNLKGKSIPLVPREKASLGASWAFLENSRLNAVITHVGKQRYDNDQANTFPTLMPGYETVDLKLSHKMRDVTLRASINNLFDRNYYSYGIRNAAGTSFNAYPQAGRTVLVAMEFSM